MIRHLAEIRNVSDYGKGCTIGTTMTITDKIVPNLVGVDIGCGMETVLLKDKRIELTQLDKAIHEHIPAGFATRKTPHHLTEEIDLTTLRCAKHVDIKRGELSIGTLGGGNHFIELDKDESGRLYLVVHSGSRNLGLQVCEHYQNAAAKQSFTLSQFEKAMKGIYSTTVNRSTLDEAPFAYKPMDEILANIDETAEITATIKPLYNFKAAE